MPDLDLNQPDAADRVGTDLAQSAAAIAQRVVESGVAVVDLPTLTRAVAERADIGATITRVETFFEPLKKMAYDLHRALCAREKWILAPLLVVDGQLRRAITDFKDAEDRARADRERDEAARQLRDEQDRAAAAAADLERAGEPALAASVYDDAIAMPTPVVVLPDATRTVPGLSFRRRYLWKFTGGPTRIADTPPALRARATRLAPPEFLILDEQKISTYARAMKGTGTIPGIDFYHVDDPIR